MIDAITKDLDQKPVVIKGVAPATRSRAFALWLALLILYFLLLPTAAETPERGVGVSSSNGQAQGLESAHRHYASAALR